MAQPECSNTEPASNTLSHYFGWIVLPGTVWFAAQMIYEQTLLTWREGPQMVGFTLTHAHTGRFFLMFISFGLAHFFLLVAGTIGVSRLVRKIPQDRLLLGQGAALAILLVLLYLPYSFWTELTLRAFGPGEHADRHLVSAAAEGDRRLIELLAAEANPGSLTTALNAACGAEQVAVAEYLVTQGAHPQGAPACEWVPEISGKRRPSVPATTIDVTQ